MAKTVLDIYKQHLAKALLAQSAPNLTPAQKAKLTKRIKQINDKLKLEFAQKP